MQKTKNINTSLLLSYLVCLCIVIFILNPAKYINSISNGIFVWATAVVPSLLPFFVLSKLLVELKFFDRFEKYFAIVSKKLFKAPAISGYIFLISIVSGYPVGAKLLQEYYKNGLLTKIQCKKISTFTSTSGPLFIVGTVGESFFNDKSIGFILLFCHILSAILCGIAFRNFFCSNNSVDIKRLPIKQTKNILNDSIYSSIIAILTVGVFISMFFMLTDMFISPFQNINGNITAFISGLFEVTKGCQLFASYFIPQHISVTICSTLISFGGLCIILQSYTYLKDCGVSIWNILCTKATQASISTILTFLFASFLL